MTELTLAEGTRLRRLRSGDRVSNKWWPHSKLTCAVRLGVAIQLRVEDIRVGDLVIGGLENNINELVVVTGWDDARWANQSLPIMASEID